MCRCANAPLFKCYFTDIVTSTVVIVLHEMKLISTEAYNSNELNNLELVLNWNQFLIPIPTTTSKGPKVTALADCWGDLQRLRAIQIHISSSPQGPTNGLSTDFTRLY